MNITWTTVLKYISWILTVGTAFVGSWFFEYTITDKETGRKQLTSWGRRGVFFAGLAFACSLALTLWTDYDAANKEMEATNKEKEATNRAAINQEHAIEFQRTAEKALTDLTAMVSELKAMKLNGEDKAAIRQAIVRNLNGLEDYRKAFPDLYAGLVQASSFPELMSTLQTGIDRGVASRIQNRPECADVPRSGPQPASYPGGVFKISEFAAMTYIITAVNVIVTFQDSSGRDSLGGSYSFVFADGGESSKLQCKLVKSGNLCTDDTSDIGARSVYDNLQKRTVVAIRSGAKRYDVSAATAEKIRTTFLCIEP